MFIKMMSDRIFNGRETWEQFIARGFSNNINNLVSSKVKELCAGNEELYNQLINQEIEETTM